MAKKIGMQNSTIRKPTSNLTPNPALNSAQDAEEAELEQRGLERLVFFSDAVYAIAITLLVIDLRLPEGSVELNNSELWRALVSMWPQYLSYILSFLVIGSFWSTHHRKFRYITGYDRNVMSINLLLLMVIAFIPFPTAVLGGSGNATATIFYAGTIVIASLLSALLWWYPRTHGLVKHSLSARDSRNEILRPLFTAAVFGLSIPIAFYNADWAKYFWAVLAPISWWFRRME
jgi:uncharacterized membrane protein